MIVKDWPLRILTPTAIGLDLYWPTRSTGEALGGDEQIGSALSARWQLSLTFSINREARVRTYRGVKASLKGRYVAVRFPIFDPFRVSVVDAGGLPLTPGGIPFSDGAFFSDGTGFASPDVTTTVTAVAALRSETIELDVGSINDALGFGQFLSVLDPALPLNAQDWLHVITDVGELADEKRTFTIAPPLRNAVSIGDEVKIGRPMSLFRLKDDMSGSVSMQYGRFGQPSMDFVEVMRRDSEA